MYLCMDVLRVLPFAAGTACANRVRSRIANVHSSIGLRNPVFMHLRKLKNQETNPIPVIDCQSKASDYPKQSTS